MTCTLTFIEKRIIFEKFVLNSSSRSQELNFWVCFKSHIKVERIRKHVFVGCRQVKNQFLIHYRHIVIAITGFIYPPPAPPAAPHGFFARSVKVGARKVCKKMRF